MDIEWQTSLPIASPIVAQLLNKVPASLPPVEVEIVPHGPSGQCYSNVRHYVENHGGRACIGWFVSYWPGRFAEAMHHAIWQAPNGELLDVTDYGFPLMTGKSVVFAADARDPDLGPINPSVPSVFLALDKSTETKEYIRAAREAVQRSQAVIAHAVRLGQYLDGRCTIDDNDVVGTRLLAAFNETCALKKRWSSKL